MIEYRLHLIRSTELRRRAAEERLARAVLRGRREARREATARRREARREDAADRRAGREAASDTERPCRRRPFRAL
jgi:hypothetical protein